MIVLTASNQKQLMSMSEAIDAVALALSEYSNQRANVPIRTFLPVESQGGTAIFMPAMVESIDSIGMKWVSIFPRNKEQGKKTLYGLVLLADIRTAEPLAMLEASHLTALRTGAASGLATRLMARADANTLGVVGTGVQARGAIDAIMAVRSIANIRLYNRNRDKAEQMANELAAMYDVHIDVVDAADNAVEEADIIVTATNSAQPVLSSSAIKPGAHINAIGSFRPHMQELPTDLWLRASKIVTESTEGALDETGDLLIPIEEGVYKAEDLYGELGELACGQKPGREREDEITIFKSVGLAAMDIVVAKQIVDKALAAGIGQTIMLE